MGTLPVPSCARKEKGAERGGGEAEVRTGEPGEREGG